MGHKNPWIAAILNFLFPGLGFLYCEMGLLAVGGAILFVASFASIFASSEWLNPGSILLSLIDSFAFGILGYGTAEIANRSLPPPPTETPTPMSFLKNCRSCGKEIPIAAEECPYCNANQKDYATKGPFPSQQPMPPPPVPSTSMSESEDRYCIHCGMKNPSVAVFCRKCGKKIGE